MPKYLVYLGEERLFERSILVGQWISARLPYPQTNFGKYDERTGYITVTTDKRLSRDVQRELRTLDPNPPNPSFLSRILRRN